MKILHTSDWHLGKALHNTTRLPEQMRVMQEICAIADRERVDVILVAGDLFDTFNPSIEATELFYQTLRKLSRNGHRPVIAIAGNHDSPDRIEAPDPLARSCGILLAGYPNTEVPAMCLESGLELLDAAPGFICLRIPGQEAPLRILMTPYANEYRLRTFLGVQQEESNMRQWLQEHWQTLADAHCDDRGVNVLMAHLLLMDANGKQPEEPEEEKPILHVGGAQAIFLENIPKAVQYVALGHLHRRQYVRKPDVAYCGSPLSYSFNESNQQKYVLLVDAQPGEPVVVNEIPLTEGKRLLQHRSLSVEDALEWLHAHPDCWVELTCVSENYLTAAQRKSLLQAHDGLLALIPEVRYSEQASEAIAERIDLNRSMEALFTEYFMHQNGQAPNEELLALFREIQASEKS